MAAGVCDVVAELTVNELVSSSSVAAPLVDFQGFRGSGCLCKRADCIVTTKVSLRSHHHPPLSIDE